MDDRSNLNTDARLTAGLLALREGVFARATGQAACLNPYAGPAANMDGVSDAQHAELALCSRAWWKGWDDEELRRRPHQLARHTPDALNSPRLSDWPLERAPTWAERAAARLKRDTKT